MKDRDDKGRLFMKQGRGNWNAKLTDEQVVEIRASNESRKAMAAKYGVRTTTIDNIVNRVSWKNI